MTGPNDRCFCYTFGQVANAESLLRHNLPPSLVARLDWSTFRRESEVLKEPEKETRNDVVFSARYLGQPPEEPPHYFIIEHQSEVEWDMAVRAYRYASRLVQLWCEAHPGWRKLPRVTVLVVYARKGSRWSAARRLEDLCSGPAEDEGHREPWALRSEYLVEDFEVRGEEVVLERPAPPLATLTLLVLAYAGRPELAWKLLEWRELIGRVLATHGRMALYRISRYLFILGHEAAYTTLRDVLHSFLEPKQTERLMRTMAQAFMDEGMAKGLDKGRVEGQVETLAKTVLRLLTARGIPVDDTARQRILGCGDVGTLERWFDRAVAATRLSEVFDTTAQ